MRGGKNIMLYLDNAATSLKKPFCVYKSIFYNTVLNSVNAGHGGHFYSLRGAKKIYDAREKISALFGIKNPEREKKPSITQKNKEKRANIIRPFGF